MNLLRLKCFVVQVFPQNVLKIISLLAPMPFPSPYDGGLVVVFFFFGVFFFVLFGVFCPSFFFLFSSLLFFFFFFLVFLDFAL